MLSYYILKLYYLFTYFYIRMKEEERKQLNNPLHGITLEMMLNDLVTHLGWKEMGERIPVKCFLNDPSIKSSLAFLRKTPWARAKVEQLYESNLKAIKKNEK